MAKEIAIGKRAKISQAQQNMLIAVFAASIFLGAGIALTMHFIQQISFNSKVIAAEEQSIVAYSDVISSTGICKSPKGKIYTKAELESCDPNSIELSDIPDTLRSNILEKLAANKALNSVPKENNSGCLNAEGKAYTFKELNKIYNDAVGTEALQAASGLIKKCSALRIIPDALPSFANQEALLSSLNKIFIISGIEPQSFTPGEASDEELEDLGYANTIPLSFTIENADTGAATILLRNIERSIREIDVNSISMKFVEGSLTLSASANAYYVDESVVEETTTTITAEGQ